jgi:HK97 family phage portal protein
MSLFSRTRAAVAAFTKDAGAAASVGANQGGGGFLPTLGSTPSATGLLISQGTAMSESAVYACVTIRSQDVARCTPRLFHEKKSGTRERVFEHDVVELFKKPNRQQTWFEFIEQTMSGYLLRGNGYAAKKGITKRGQVEELIPVNPDAVLVLESGNGEIFYNVNRLGLWQLAMLREFPPTIAAEDMFHLRGLSFNALVALSTIGNARDSIGVAMGLEQQAARWMKNGARPSMVLESAKPLSKPTAARLKQQFDDTKSGLANTGETVVLEDGITAKPLQLTSVDVEFIQQRQFSVVDICRFYRMPPFKLGVTELRGVDLEAVNNEYVSGAIMPDLHRLEERIQFSFDLRAQDISVSFDERVLLRSDTKTRFANARLGLGGAAFLKVNEVRAGEQLSPVADGDIIYQPANLAGIGSDHTGSAADGAGRPESGRLPDPGVAPPKPPPADDDDAKAVRDITFQDASGQSVTVKLDRLGEAQLKNALARPEMKFTLPPAREWLNDGHPVNGHATD